MLSKIKTVTRILKKQGLITLLNYIMVKFKIPIYLNDFKIKNFNEFISYLKIYDIGIELIRVGPNSDGGYLVPNILKEIEFCYSPGVGDSSFFEDQLLKEYNIKSFLADGTLLNEINTDHLFIKKNIDLHNSAETITMETWVNEYTKNNKNLMLQMDIEGAELEILNNLNSDFLNRFKILIIEFHDLMLVKNKIAYDLFFKLFKKLNQTHTICHIHPNNMAGEFLLSGYRFPKLAEITFIKNDLIKKKEKIKKQLPHPMDYKNYNSNPEIKLSSIFYK